MNNLEDEIIEKILGISLQVKTNKGDRVIHFKEFKNEEGTLSLNSDDSKQPRNQIVLTLNCDGYSMIVE